MEEGALPWYGRRYKLLSRQFEWMCEREREHLTYFWRRRLYQTLKNNNAFIHKATQNLTPRNVFRKWIIPSSRFFWCWSGWGDWWWWFMLIMMMERIKMMVIWWRWRWLWGGRDVSDWSQQKVGNPNMIKRMYKMNNMGMKIRMMILVAAVNEDE